MSVVVPCEPGGDPRACLAALEALPDGERAGVLEVLVASGRNPSRQRNLAVAQAGGDWVLFLDSDSRAEPGLLRGLLEAAASPRCAAAGGPNLPLADEGPLGLRFDAVLASWAGSMASRARYTPVGERRLSGEKELILCNLLVRREAFAQAGGFREDLYPNEENELFNRLQAAGWELVYEPAARVRRPRRDSVAAFALQSFRYGRGRSQQMRRNFFPGDLLNLLPLALPLAWAACAGVGAAASGGAAWLPWPALAGEAARALPLAYLGACFLASGLRPSVALFLALRHHAYAAGLLTGLFQDTPPRSPDVQVERRTLHGPEGRDL